MSSDPVRRTQIDTSWRERTIEAGQASNTDRTAIQSAPLTTVITRWKAGQLTMTRMWCIAPRFLCDQHLLGEHSELHQLVGTLEKHPHGEAIVRGYADKQQVDSARIRERHDTLAAEMESRGMRHDSPHDYRDDLNLGSIDPDRNRTELERRCRDCRARIEQAE